MKLNRKLLWMGAAVFLLAVVARGMRLSEKLFFGFEQGRDAMRIQSLLQFEDIMLVGPKTDIARIFHGPWYYYFMTIPYFIGSGEPLIAAEFLIILGALLAVLFYYWWYELTKKKWMAVVGGLATAFSFELITYSRWLSNVSPTLPLFGVGFYALWRYYRSNKGWWFVASLSVMALAAQFEIVLTFWLVVALLVLVITKLIKLPSWRFTVLGLVAAGFWYLPLLAFNVKYDFLTVKSILALISGEGSEGGLDLIANLQGYGRMLFRLWQKTVFFLPGVWSAVAALLSAGGVALLLQDKKEPKWRWLVLVSLIFLLSTLPVVFFGHSLGLIQVYAGIGIALLQLALLGVWGWSSEYVQTKNKWALVGLGAMLLLFGSSAVRSLKYVWEVRDTFYRTIQDDLNYSDQRRIIQHIVSNRPPEGVPYFIKAFTIPYYQEEGWMYLHEHLVGDPLDPGAGVIFVIIEEKVDPYWREQWIKDLGETYLVEEHMFGRILLQERWR